MEISLLLAAAAVILMDFYALSMELCLVALVLFVIIYLPIASNRIPEIHAIVHAYSISSLLTTYTITVATVKIPITRYISLFPIS